MKSNLAEKWRNEKKTRLRTFPVSVRLRPQVDAILQEFLAEFPHLTATQIINDVLEESLKNLRKSII